MDTLVAVKSGMVVIRYLDKRLLKGTTEDFYPDKPEFHVHEAGNERGPAQKVAFRDLKAVFFVRSYEGNREHNDNDDLSQAKGQGRKIEVVFKDGEVLRGFTVGYSRLKQGFFVIPADPEPNNARVYVINAAVREVRWR